MAGIGSPTFAIGLCDGTLKADRPNVLLIMVDDLRDYGGAFTREAVKTPNLDRLRAHGTTFERAYVQYPVCNPSRSSMMSGLRPEQTGIVGNDTRIRQKLPNVITMPQLCKDAGWQTHAFGKLYHLGGGKDAEQKALWMDSGRSWHTAQAFEVTQLGRKMLAGRNLAGGALNWCQWGAADGTDEDQPDGQIAAATVAKIIELGNAPWFIGCGFIEFVDLYPTVTDFCSLKLPHEVAGLSLRPILEHPDASVKKTAFTLVSRGPKLYGQSIRTARWRFTRWSDDQNELYDHDQDPEELHDVTSENPRIVKELSKQLQTIGKPQP